jgi:hypothetical protein
MDNGKKQGIIEERTVTLASKRDLGQVPFDRRFSLLSKLLEQRVCSFVNERSL